MIIKDERLGGGLDDHRAEEDPEEKLKIMKKCDEISVILKVPGHYCYLELIPVLSDTTPMNTSMS